MSDFDLSPPMKTAVVWTIVSELFRRHHRSSGLWLTIQRPCDGQYFCVTLEKLGMDGPRAMWNLFGTSLAIEPCPEVLPDWWEKRCPAAAVTSPGLRVVVNDIERAMGLPPWTGPHDATTPTTLIVRVIAELAQRRAFSESTFWADSGFYSSSGYGGCDIRDWVGVVAAEKHGVAKRALASGEWQEATRIAARYWAISFEPSQDTGRYVLLDLANADAFVVRSSQVKQRLSLWERFGEHGRRVSPVTDWVEARCKQIASDL